jgi:hypothetical protein
MEQLSGDFHVRTGRQNSTFVTGATAINKMHYPYLLFSFFEFFVWAGRAPVA